MDDNAECADRSIFKLLLLILLMSSLEFHSQIMLKNNSLLVRRLLDNIIIL